MGLRESPLHLVGRDGRPSFERVSKGRIGPETKYTHHADLRTSSPATVPLALFSRFSRPPSRGHRQILQHRQLHHKTLRIANRSLFWEIACLAFTALSNVRVRTQRAGWLKEFARFSNEGSAMEGYRPDDAFHFIQVSKPSAKDRQAAWKKQVRSFAARKAWAQQKSLARRSNSSEPFKSPKRSVDDGYAYFKDEWITSVVPTANTQLYDRDLFNPSPVTPLGAARIDPFKSFSRRMSPFESYLLDHCKHILS